MRFESGRRYHRGGIKMPEEISYFAFIAMVVTIMINIVCAMNYRKAKKHCERLEYIYEKLCYVKRQGFWKTLGAYPAPENGEYYLDLEGDLRLIIYDGKIEGWYKA